MKQAERFQEDAARTTGRRDIEVWRGDLIESAHAISAAVVDQDGRLLHYLGDPYLVTNLRSSAKPFQVIPLLQALDESDPGFDFTLEELAIMAGSHSGGWEHARVVQGILEKIGFSEEHLQCGTHPPLGKKERKAVGGDFTAIHNNCSGKHAAMLALCRIRSYDDEGYCRPDHPVQQLIRRSLSVVMDVPEERIGQGIDGCGVPVFYFSLYQMAHGFARFVSGRDLCSQDDNDLIPRETCQKIVDAMLAYPEMIGGEDRFDTDVMKVANCDDPVLISKLGAEGFGTLSLLEEGLGMAVKVEDGGDRAICPAVIHILKQMAILSDEQTRALEDHYLPKIHNRRKDVVGGIVPNFTLDHPA